MIHATLSPHEMQIAQMMIGVTAAVFIGGRFLPPRYRRKAGIVVTICYLAGIAAFLAYVLFVR